MARVAILGGGIAGLVTAYELEQQRCAGRPVDWYLFETSAHLGGNVATTRIVAAEGEYLLEDGPDGWLTEKPWARDLAVELGLGPELIPCNEADRRTYLWLDGQLVPMPGRMRFMVPEDLATLEGSPLFTPSATRAYALELQRAHELKSEAPEADESVASFVRRHFGEEILAKVAAPLLSGVFGGDVERLSVRAVMPAFVAWEREHGSLIAALQQVSRERGSRASVSTFTSLQRGMGSLPAAIVAALPPGRVHTGCHGSGLRRAGRAWLLQFTGSGAGTAGDGPMLFDQVVFATPADATRTLLAEVDSRAAELLPCEASSAVLVTFCWPVKQAAKIRIPGGFGFLVPPLPSSSPQLLAATFANQKYACRAPDGSRMVRTFFGDEGAKLLADAPDAEVARAALTALQAVLGALPEPPPDLCTVRRWPRSLPQYEVGHLDRMAELRARVQALGSLDFVGNSYQGVGIPDLVREARLTARGVAAKVI